MSLNTVLEKIKTLQPFADEDVESGRRETLTARRGRKNQAIESLKSLKQQYSADLRQTAAFILVVGDKREEFVSIANEHYKTFSANPEEFYLDLANRIPQVSYLGRESVSNLFDILGRHLEDKMLSLEIVSGYPQLIFRQQYQKTIRTQEDFLNLIKEAVVAQLGGEMVGIQAIHTLTNEAIKRNHTSKFTPILLPTGDEKFALTVATDLERISSKVFVVVAGDAVNSSFPEDAVLVKEPTNNSVKNALKTISNQLKK